MLDLVDHETYRLKSVARLWIGKLDIRYLNKHQSIQYHNDRLEEVFLADSIYGVELRIT